MNTRFLVWNLAITLLASGMVLDEDRALSVILKGIGFVVLALVVWFKQ
jgi:hypothetical protein